MNFNSLFFPAPQKSYSHLTFYNELIYIPKNSTKNKKTMVSYIPCLFIPYKPRKNGQITQQYQKDLKYQEKVYKSHKMLIYFHGNAEDIGHSHDFLNQISSKFHLNILSVEYPGYGIYKNEEADCEIISSNSQVVFDYVIQSLKYDPKDVILFGRSMGSGPATYLAEIAKPAALILLSPYTSLRDCVKSLIGTLPSFLVKERFKNLDVIKKVSCPTLIVHGQSDALIPFSHAQQLHINCGGPSKLIMPKKMTHNEFDMQRDLFEPIKQFFIESNLLTSCVRGTVQIIKEKYFVPPRYFRDQVNDGLKKSFATDKDSLIDQDQSKFDSLKKAKSSPSLIPLIMTQAYQQQKSNQFQKSSNKISFKEVLSLKFNQIQSNNLENRIDNQKKFPLTNFQQTKDLQEKQSHVQNSGVQQTNTRDKSPVPQSEEKLKLVIRDSVRAKNMKSIDLDKRMQLNKSVKENFRVIAANYKVGPKTSRAQAHLSKDIFTNNPSKDIKSIKASFHHQAKHFHQDINTDNTVIQDELRSRDQMSIKQWRGIFERYDSPVVNKKLINMPLQKQ